MSNDIVQKMKEALINAKSKIDEQQDFIEAVKGEPLGYGIVLDVQTATFTPKDFPLGSQVRVLRGPDQGKVSTVFHLSETKVTTKSYRSRKTIDYEIFRDMDDVPELKIFPGTDKEQVLKGALPHEFTLGNQVWNDRTDEWNTITAEVDFDGTITAVDDDSDAYSIWVGPDHLIAPLGKQAGSVQVLYQGRVINCNVPRDFTVSKGDPVNLSQQTCQIVSVNNGHTYGNLGHIKKVLDPQKVEVETDGGMSKVVYSLLPADQLEVGVRISLDVTNQVILLRLPEEKPVKETITTGVNWNSIGGQESAKRSMIEAIEWPIQYKDIYAHYNKKGIGGILLYGPPGTGKTMFGKAAATAVAELYGSEAAATGFMSVKGPELLSMYVGAAEASIRQLFNNARKHKKEHGYPAILFIDEAESILSKRGSGVSSDMEKTIVPTFLTEMNGMEDSGAIVILATNRPDRLDPAITRDQRIDRKIKVDRPTLPEAMDIFRIYLSKCPLDPTEKASMAELCEFSAKELFSDSYRLGTVVFEDGEKSSLNLSNAISGAMIATIVDTASTYAVSRDISSQTTSGVSKQDLLSAIQFCYEQNLDTDKMGLAEELQRGRRIIRIHHPEEASNVV